MSPVASSLDLILLGFEQTIALKDGARKNAPGKEQEIAEEITLPLVRQ